MPGLYAGTDLNNDFRKVELSDVKIDRPTVVYLPGRGQSDTNLGELSKGVHFVNKLCADLETPPSVYIWSHSDKYNKSNIKSLLHVAAVNYGWGYSSPAGKDLAAGLIGPLVLSPEGKPLPYHEVQKNLRNLTLLGYCLGSTTAQELYNASLKMMRQAGYPRGQARRLLREVVLVSFANFTRPRRERHRWTTLSLVNTDDVFIGVKDLLVNTLARPISNPVKIVGRMLHETSGVDKLKIKILSQSSTLVKSAVKGNLTRHILREAFQNVTHARWKWTTSHDARSYVTDEESNQLAGIAKRGVMNAVGAYGQGRTSKLGSLDLLKEPEGYKETQEQAIAHIHKIERGLQRGKRGFIGNMVAS